MLGRPMGEWRSSLKERIRALVLKTRKLRDGVIGKRYDILDRIVASYERGSEGPDVLFIGDSTLLRVSRNDGDRRVLGEMLRDGLKGKLTLMHLAYSAYHVKVYFHFVKLLTQTAQRPKMAVLTINMRSFSPSWYLRPEFQFLPEVKVIEKYMADRASIGRIKKKKVRAPFYELPVDYPLTNLKTIGDFEACIREKTEDDESLVLKRRREIFIYYYLYRLSDENPNLVKLKELVRLARHQRLRLLLYVTPINYESALRTVGEEFQHHFFQNMEKLKAVLRAEGVSVNDDGALGMEEVRRADVAYLDFSRCLPSDGFFYADFMTEHMNQKGRSYLAEKLAENLLMMLGRGHVD